MMRGRLVLLLVLMTVAAPVWAAAQTPDPSAQPLLRRWHLGVQGVGVWRDRHDVFGLPDLPAGTVAKDGSGIGVFIGRRLGDRFLLDLQVAAARHDDADGQQAITSFEFLLTGTVLFRSHHTVQPFLRGAVGGGGEVLNLAGDQGHLASVGTATVAGGGLQIRLSSRVSLDLETVATFSNYLEVDDESEGNLWPEDSWQVRVSGWGWRTGIGVMFWF